jgi:VanZ family protein
VLLTWPPPPSASELAALLPAPLEHVADKAAHAALFLVQALLLHRALRGGDEPARALLVTAVLLAVLYGGATELRQRGVEGRDPDVWDVVADAVGALAYAAGARLSRARERAAGSGRGARASGLAGGGGGG